jgi:NAD(P)-dependent dehydrogenase (short-subunit alcohol dehydrogenase family)
METLLIAGSDSDLAIPVIELARLNNWAVIGTTRRKLSYSNNNLLDKVFECDFSSSNSIDKCTQSIIDNVGKSRMITVISVGTLEPIGKFAEIDFDSWQRGFEINGLGPLRFIQNLLANRQELNDLYLTFAGNGTNSAPTHFSSYTLAKIMLIKAMEILSKEYPNQTFVSLGTGWMKSKIHESVLISDNAPTEIKLETQRRIDNNDFGNPMRLSAFLKEIIIRGNKVSSGRNFSLQGDLWDNDIFWEDLLNNENRNKLRRLS